MADDASCDESLAGDDNALLTLAIERMNALASPSQSLFRVYCIIVVGHLEPADDMSSSASSSAGPRIDVGSSGGGGRCIASYSLLYGANSESGSYISSSICAERAALTKLRFYSDYKILKFIITTDSDQPIAPGYLCREYISSYAEQDSVIVCSNSDRTKVMTHLIRDIFPLPYIYNKCHKASLLGAGEALSRAMPPVADALDRYRSSSGYCPLSREEVLLVYTLARSYSKLDKSSIHPICLGAAVLYMDGSVESAAQIKALEYGCSVDAVVQLVVLTERRRLMQCQPCESKSYILSITPKLIICTDQFGICHTLGGQARALLSEALFPTDQLRMLVSAVEGSAFPETAVVSLRVVEVMEDYKLSAKLDDLSDFLCSH